MPKRQHLPIFGPAGLIAALSAFSPASCGSGGGNEASGHDAGASSGGGGSSGDLGAHQPDAMGLAPIDPCVEAGTCPTGVWEREDLPGYASPDTVEAVLADPVRPSDFYAFVGSNNGPMIKVYRSTDFGVTWVNRNTTAAITGNPWGASIDPNPSRDPATPPTMWSPSGYGAAGAWKSVDGGATWRRSAACDTAFSTYNPFGNTLTDLYHVRILPDDPPNHVLATYHYSFKNASDGGFGETWDGGASWVVHPPPAGIGTSHYVIPISATTWAVIAQNNNGANGIWRTTTAGRTGGTAAKKYRDGTISTSAWSMVDTLEHVHGSHENLVLADGTIFATGETNGARSTDQGATWQHFTMNGSWAPPHQSEGSDISNIAATGKYLYTNWLAHPATLARALRADPIGADKWDIAYCTTPTGMNEGGAPFGMASSFDASLGKWVVVAGTYNSGMWRYVEP
jgi:hypothetical protein